MILGVSHVLIGCANLAAEAAVGSAQDCNIDTQPEKLPLMRLWRHQHSIAVSKASLPASEFIEYSGEPYSVVTTTNTVANGSILLSTDDPARSLTYWRAIFNGKPMDATTIGIRGPVKSLTAQVTFQKGPRYFLDDLGLNCVCLLTNDIWADFSRMTEAGAEGFSPILVKIGGRGLTIAMARCPTGELIELLQVPTSSISD